MDTQLSDLLAYITQICQKRSIKNIELYDSKERIEVQLFFEEEPRLHVQEITRIPVKD